ncbi:trigger factor [Lysobacter enzymogenes]|jgi:trigger factor|uniref:Trigger factor n=1 Tax=Lysobacter enzymogenes TaxID=69 RepID=A0AAU9AEZ4_LYSEN|nr:trigger factor [Lysobacter enzymogenes]BAV97184.1 trigger factor [Lysobacter enzymogenes]SDX01491.1 trigger factor [Lysobacter enzymogenes]
MQVSLESLGSLERRLTFSLPAENLETQVGGRLREIARGANIKGFRPGKVPAKIIEQRFGAQVRAEILDGMLRESFGDAVRKEQLQIAGNPSIEPAGEAEGTLSYVATFEVVPDFGDIDVSKLEVVRHTAEVSDADIDAMIENLRLQRRTLKSVERGAQDGDIVEVETWTEVDGLRLPAEGAEHGSTQIGSGAMFKPLEDAMIGVKAGEEKVAQVEFPADWRAAEVAGKTANVHLKINHVSEPVLPEVDAEFIKSFGVRSGDAEQFRADIRTNLERELKGALMNRLRQEVGEQLVKAYEAVEMPPKLVEQEARNMVWQTVEQARRQGRQISAPDDAHLSYMDSARKRVLVGLLVGEIARRNDLRLEAKRVNETLRLIASTYEEPQQVIDLYRNDQQLMAGLQNRVMEEQVIDWIAERAQHTEQPLSFSDAIRPN